MARPNILNGESGLSARDKINAIGRFRGSFDASSDLFPSDDVVAGDWWYSLNVGEFDGEDWPSKTIFIALDDDPGQDETKWRLI